MANLSNIKLTPKQNLIAIVFILVILLALGLRLYFSGKAVELSGPNFTVANDSIVVLVYNRAVYRLDENGNILQRISFDDIGIRTKVADIQLLDNQRFVIGDWDSEIIQLCEFAGSSCRPLTEKLGKHVLNFFKFYYREASNDLFIADTDRHRILHYDPDTHEVKKISSTKQFIFPNHLQIEADDYLYITDTNHHRIAAFEYQSDKLDLVEPDYRVPGETSKKKWPVFYYRMGNGDIYILQGNNLLAYADLVFMPREDAASNLPLPEGADVTDIARIQNQLLLSDRKLFTIHALDTRSHELTAFGGDELKTMFSKHRAEAETYDMLSSTMLGLMVLAIIAMVGFIIFLAVRGQRTAPTSGPVAEYNLPPIVPGRLTWVDANPKFRLLFPLLVIMILLLFATLFALFGLLKINLRDAVAGSPEQGLLYALFGMVLLFVLVMVNAAQNLYTRIGTDGIYIYIRRFGKQYRLRPQNMLYSPHYLVYANLVIPYRNIMKHYFRHRDQFEAYITPLLRAHSREISTFFDVVVHLIKHPNMMSIFNTVTLIILVLILIFIFQIDAVPTAR